MSKKRLAVVLILIVLAVTSNCLVLKYKENSGDSLVTITVKMKLGNDDTVQLFYIDSDDESASFSEEKSVSIKASGGSDFQKLSFNVPKNSRMLRLDLGSTPGNEIEIDSVSAEYKKEKEEKENNPAVNNEGTNDLEVNDGIIVTNGSDPYIVIDCSGWELASLVDSYHESRLFVGLKIAACALIDLVILYFIFHLETVLSFPREVYQNRKLIFRLSVNDFKTRYAASFLGVFWAFVQPLVTILVYWFVFEKGLKAGSQSLGAISVPFVLFLISGIVPWFFFQDALNGVTGALTSYTYLVKKVVFNIEVLPVVKVAASIFVHIFFVCVTVIIFWLYGYTPDFHTLQLLYYSVAMVVLLIGIGYVTCSIVVFFRDLSELINIILSIGIWITPIMWNLDTTIKSPVLKAVFKINPLYYITAGYRDSLINKVWFFEHPALTIYFWSLTLLIFFGGRKLFSRLRVHFADVL